MQLNSLKNEALLEFCDSYREVDWNSLINQAESSLIICVYFWDKWVQQHEQALCDFLKKPKACIEFFFSNAFTEVQRLFPQNTVEQLRRKVRDTYLPLQNFLEMHHLPATKIKIHYLPFPLNYSMQCLDEKILLLSFFEMFRMNQVDSPLISIDLDKAPNSKKFYTKELLGFRACSKI